MTVHLKAVPIVISAADARVELPADDRVAQAILALLRLRPRLAGHDTVRVSFSFERDGVQVAAVGTVNVATEKLKFDAPAPIGP